jgi:hypothetical protein
MDLGTRLPDVLGPLLGTLFAAWPLLLLAPITWKHQGVATFLRVWLVVALVRIGSAIVARPGLSVIPEPASTLFFLAVGITLGLVYMLRRATNSPSPPIR